MINKPIFWVIFNVVLFGVVFLQGYKWHPRLALVLSIGGGVAMMILASRDPTWIAGSLVLCFIFLFILRKPDQRQGFKDLFAKHNIYTSQKTLPAAYSLLGDKKWRYAEGRITIPSGKIISYSFWQGSTSSLVSSGQYVRTTTHTYYMAFIFPPGSVNDAFKQRVIAAADKSGYSKMQRLKFLFAADTETPDLVGTAEDGSFIIRYVTLQEAACYARRFEWIEDNINLAADPIKMSAINLN